MVLIRDRTTKVFIVKPASLQANQVITWLILQLTFSTGSFSVISAYTSHGCVVFKSTFKDKFAITNLEPFINSVVKTIILWWFSVDLNTTMLHHFPE